MIGPTLAASASPPPDFSTLFLAVWPRLLVSLAIAAWGAWSARAAVRRLIGSPSWDVTACAIAVLLATSLLATAMALGTFSLLRPWIWGIAVTASANILWAWSRQGRPIASVAGPAPSAFFVIAIGGLMIGRALFGLRNPPADVDTIAYHLPMVAHWFQSGSLGAPLHVPPAVGMYFPGSGELFHLALACVTGRETLLAWAGILATGVLGLALRPLGLAAGASPLMAEVLAVCLCASPGVVQLTLGTKIDVMVAAWFAIALLFALRFRRTAAAGELTVMLCAAGVLAGTKSNGPVFALLLGAVALLGSGAGARLRVLAARRASLALALLMGGFWYVRNLVATGNPLFPAQLHIGGWSLPGLLPQETLRRTSQLAIWLDGHGGNLTPRNLVTFFGTAIVIGAIGIALRLALPRHPSRPPANGTPTGVALLGSIALACFLVFIVIPFSGASHAASAGRLPVVSVDNIRYLLPGAVCLLPLAAAGLTRVPGAPLIAALLMALALLDLRILLGHLLPGVALAAVLTFGVRRIGARLARRPVVTTALGVAGVATLLALAVAAVDPLRQRLSDRIHDGYVGQFRQLRARDIEALRAEARGRPIAVVGVFSQWPYYGRDFSGRTIYVPLDLDLAEAGRPYRFLPDPRTTNDRERWLEHLRAIAPAFVVTGPLDDCVTLPVEAGWCASDPERFTPVAEEGCVRAYRVRSP